MACQAECVSPQIDLFGATDPPVMALIEDPNEHRMEPDGGGGVVPCEGDAANTGDGREKCSPGSQVDFLDDGGW